ncbi:kinesin-like protein KIN-12C [Lolium rigidum]|uniref:kinesin-like protein KIN-12C n=1 Tax=Lolium rigidum TaxID=89674 RepID=UPI001F5DB9D6|nr:kinesin-like protein KIN-12C [Lolium rigidum]
MEMLRRNLKRQASRSLSAFAAADDQENLHPNLAAAEPPMSPPNKSKPTASAAVPPPPEAADQNRAAPARAPADHEPPVKVVVRVRPAVSLPVDGKDLFFVRKTSPTSVAVGDRAFAVDGFLDDRASQEDAFNLVGLPMIDSALAGVNTSLVCYGQSGTGKTYTMWGPLAAMFDSRSNRADSGIVPRFFQHLFSQIQGKQETSPEKQTSYQCRCSFLEVFNEQINDLLDPSQRNLQIRETTGNGIHVENLTDEYVSTVEDVNQILMKGLSKRKIGTDSMNLKNSRSHVIFTCVVEAWSKDFSSNGFSSSKTSKITFVDLAGLDIDELEGNGKQFTREERHVKKSLSTLGKLVNILSEEPKPQQDDLPYRQSRLTHVLKDTLGGNSRVTFLCSISSEHRYRSDTLSTLRFGERAKLMPNKAVINEISEDDVNGLSDQIRQLKDELVRTKSGQDTTCETGYFNAQNARASLHSLRVSLNRSLILPHIEVESEDEMDVDEDDVHELRDQISKLHSSSEDTLDDFLDAESGEDSPCSKGNPKTCEHDDQVIMDDREGALQEEVQKVYSNTDADQEQVSDMKSSLSICASPQLGPMQDPTFCSSPKIHKARKSITSPGFSPSKLSESSPGDLTVEMSRKSAVRSSLQSSKLSPTDSLAASLQRGLHIIEYHQQNPSPRKSFVGLSFDHFALNPRQSAKASSALHSLPEEHVGSVSTICSSCKKALGTNDDHSEDINSGKQIVMATGITSNDLANASRQDGTVSLTTGSKREAELEALCEEQAAKIKELTILIEQHKGAEDGQQSDRQQSLTDEDQVGELCEDSKVSLNVNEREALLDEIQNLKDQVKHLIDGSTNDSLLDQIRNGSTDQEYELDKERQKWMESESKWISLTEELRVDLESNRIHAEKTKMELCNEKKCTEELDDALQRAIYGHARIIEHYVELQEMYNDLLERHRRVMEGISEVKRAAAKAGRKGCGTAFAAALAAELSTVRIDREKERAQLKEQNRRLRIQLRDTAEAVHAAGELLVRLREAEEASTQQKEKSAAMLQENQKLKKQLEKMRKKHEMEVETMKHYLAESKLPESALEGFYRQESNAGAPEYSHAQSTCDDDQSWRAAFTTEFE